MSDYGSGYSGNETKYYEETVLTAQDGGKSAQEDAPS